MTDPSISLPLLVIDTSSRRVCVALIDGSESVATRFSNEEASLSLFPLIANILAERELKLDQLKSIAFCEGPGSTLGIRTAIMGIRAWQGAGLNGNVAIFSFSSLRVGYELLTKSASPGDSFLVVTDARRNSWNCLKTQNREPCAVTLLENQALENASLPIFSFDEFPSWTKTVASIDRKSYRPEIVFEDPGFTDLLKPNPAAEPMNVRTMEFAKWIPKARTSDQIET